MYADDELLAVSGLQHLAFCERQWALIHVEQSWQDSADTLRGDFFHQRVDSRGYACARGIRAERRLRLTNRELGLYGIADIVEFDEAGSPDTAVPVEYKVGRPKMEDWDKVQLAAQALCLEEMLSTSVLKGAIFYGETRRREQVEIGVELRRRVEALASRMHELFDQRVTPRATLRSRCRRCSLMDVCLPEASENRGSSYWTEFGESWEMTETNETVA